MVELKITLWNGDVLTVPLVKGRYSLKSIVHHMRLSLKQPEPEPEVSKVFRELMDKDGRP